MIHWVKERGLVPQPTSQAKMVNLPLHQVQKPHRPRPLLLLPTLVILLPLLLFPPLPAAEAQSLWQLRSLISIAHSLLLRVANLRWEREDLEGAARVRSIADGLGFLGPGSSVWSLGWDYARNYARQGAALRDFPSRDAWELLSELRDFGRMRSDRDRARWISRNYSKVVSLLRSVLRGLLGTFYRSGPLREMVLTLQAEVAEGDLLRDCMEVGAKDLEGLATIVRDYFFSFSRSENKDNEL